MTRPPGDEMDDFTESNYRRLLKLAASKYRFVSYGEEPPEPFVIWRHDIDYSPHRALAFAQAEAEQGLRCNYHVLVSGRYYNVLEPDIAAIIRKIAALGHEIGLHFDMDVVPDAASATEAAIRDRIAFEKRIVETIAEVSVATMSFHNHVLHAAHLDRADDICGMCNASNERFQKGYKYVSDSNGIWRYDRLEDVLTEPAHSRLHVLTHPIWWAPEAMPPVMRLRRVVEGRACASFGFYADVMKRDGRYSTLAHRLGFTDAESDGT
ncbi:MAG: hypothetical protein MJE12_15435 [Alphaproteobacteria bacterium]|nr:hypothetical protein [Alphaproteobacteria bacterium]